MKSPDPRPPSIASFRQSHSLPEPKRSESATAAPLPDRPASSTAPHATPTKPPAELAAKGARQSHPGCFPASSGVRFLPNGPLSAASPPATAMESQTMADSGLQSDANASAQPARRQTTIRRSPPPALHDHADAPQSAVRTAAARIRTQSPRWRFPRPRLKSLESRPRLLRKGAVPPRAESSGGRNVRPRREMSPWEQHPAAHYQPLILRHRQPSPCPD